MPMMMNKLARKSVAGFTLVEVMVALLVFSAGLLGIIGLLVVAAKANSSSYIKQQATQAANDIVDRMHSNSVAATQTPTSAYVFSNLVTTGSPTLPTTPTTNCGSATCSAAQMATYDLWYWATNEVGLLPNGCASITASATGNNTLVTVTIQWDDAAAEGKLGASTSASVTGQPNLAQISIQTLL